MTLSYDKANRLTGATGTGGFANYNESPIQYDANGNIVNLTRTYNNTVIDQLAYKYNGNQLHRVDDTNNNEGQAVKGFINGANADNEMRYDGNGNLTADDNRGINPVAYNVLNLPRSLTRNGRTVQYTYDGAGVKLKSEAPDNVNTLYAGAFEYKGDGTLQRIGLEEGQLVKEGSSYVVQYYLRDHLGNVRSVMDENGNVLQETEYYAFGLPVQRTGSDKNKYLYNGKEKQPETEWLDYGARMYDPSIGRWMTVDRYSEKYYSLSGYQYCGLNPVSFLDINGDSLWINYKGNNVLYQNGGLYNKDGSTYTGAGTKKDKNGNVTGYKGFLGQAFNTLNQISASESKAGTSVINELQASSNNFTIADAANNPRVVGANEFVSDNRNGEYAIAMLDAGQGRPQSGGSGGTVYWNPNSSDSQQNGINELGGQIGVRLTTNLAHELFHSYDSNRGFGDNRPVNGLKRGEWRAVYFENQIRSQMGFPLRESYNLRSGPVSTLTPVNILGVGLQLPTPVSPPSITWLPNLISR